MKIRHLPKSLLLGGTRLHHGTHQSITPEPDGVRRINERCIELDTYLNLVQGGSAGAIGITLLISPIICISAGIIAEIAVGLNKDILIGMLIAMPVLPCVALIFYYAGGAHRCRGAFIRINRITRKIYFVPPKTPNKMLIFDWDQIEGCVGFIPIVTAHTYTSRHPLYLIGIDYTVSPPTELCIACGNLGVIDGSRSARTLWAYLQHFMAYGPQGLPAPPPLTAKLSRREAAIQPYRQWLVDFKKELCEPYGWLKAPITIPIQLTLFLMYACLNSSEAWIQYNVPYVAFPHANDVLCGFAEKRKPVIRVNGIKL